MSSTVYIEIVKFYEKAPGIIVELFMCCALRWSFSFQWSLDNEKGRVRLKKAHWLEPKSFQMLCAT